MVVNIEKEMINMTSVWCSPLSKTATIFISSCLQMCVRGVCGLLTFPSNRGVKAGHWTLTWDPSCIEFCANAGALWRGYHV